MILQTGYRVTQFKLHGNDQPESGHLMSSKVIDKFPKERYSEVYGARPFKRLIGE